MKKFLKKWLRREISECVETTVQEIREEFILRLQSLELERQETAKKPARKKPPKNKGKKLTAEEMRCRFTKNKQRCGRRSKGSRFHFLCAEHLDTPTPIKKVMKNGASQKKETQAPEVGVPAL